MQGLQPHDELKTCGTTAVQPDKVGSMWQAIKALDEITNHTLEILEKAKGEGMAREDVRVPESAPTLQTLMQSGSAKIHDKINEAHKLLSELEEVIF